MVTQVDVQPKPAVPAKHPTSARIRIAYVIDFFGRGGGTENQLAMLINNLDQTVFEPYLYTLRSGPFESKLPVNCPVKQLNITKLVSLHSLKGIWEFAGELRRNRIDILQLFFIDSNMFGVIAGRLARVPNIIISRRDMGWWYADRHRHITNLLNRFSHHCIANAQAIKEVVAANETIPEDHIEVIYNGLTYNEPAEDSTITRATFGIPESVPIVGIVANLKSIKRIDRFVRIAAKLKHTDTHFLIVGFGTEQQKLRELAQSLGITERVHFYYTAEHVFDVMRLFSVGALTSDSEGLSNVLVEYGLSGIPAVTFDIGGNREAIQDGVTGFLIPAFDEDAMARRIDALLAEPATAQQIGRSARQYVNERFSVEQMVEATESFYRRITVYKAKQRPAHMSTLYTFMRLSLLETRYSRRFGEIVSVVFYALGLLLVPFSRRQSAKLLMLSHRNSFSERRQVRREQWLNRLNLLNPKIIASLIPPHEALAEPIYQSRVITLKEPQGKEKGVILLKFLDTFSWFCRNFDMKRVLNDYYLALELSYYGTCRPEVLQFTAYADHSIVVGAAIPLERRFLTQFRSNLVPASFSSCTWIDDRTFFPTYSEKIYDCIMVTTWNPVKRHYLLFEALAQIDDPTYHALIIGGSYGGTRQEIEAQIDYYGVRDKITVMQDIDQKDINLLLGKSRVNLLLSLKEGGNKAIIEGMFADIPALILNDLVGIDYNWVNEQTGRVVDKSKLAETMLWFRTTNHQFTPRNWAMEHISCHISTEKLEQTFKEIAKQRNEPWTQSLAVKYNQGSTPHYYNEYETLAPFPFEKYRIAYPLIQTTKA